MRKEKFKEYLTTQQNTDTKPYKKSTADMMAYMCSSIEKEYGMDLDNVLGNPTEKSRLLDFVSTIERANPDRYMLAILNYIEFFNHVPYVPYSPSLITRYPFSYYPDAVLDGIDDGLLCEMEGEYECILRFGRQEIFKNACEDSIDLIPVTLSPEIKKRAYKPNDAEIAREICELFRKKKGEASVQEIMAILKNRKGFTDYILGEFIKTPEPHIVLYYKAIGGKTREEMIAGLANVLAHEYMHYMEYRYCLSKGEAFYHNEKLSEAMADFFGVLYLLQRECFVNYALNEKEAVAECRYNEWESRLDTCWPYAKALYFYTVCGNTMAFSRDYADYVNHQSVSKLIEVFINCFDCEKAYQIMINY